MIFSRLLPAILSAAALVLVVCLQAQGATPEDNFNAGVEAYRHQDFATAKTKFSEVVEHAASPSAYYNLALSESKLGEKGRALAHLRMALSLDPSYLSASQAHDFFSREVDRPFALRETPTWEWLRNSWLLTVSLHTYLAASALLLLAFGWLTLGYLGRRRHALRNEEALPSQPVVAWILALPCSLALGMSAAKTWDLVTPRATIVSDKSPIRSAPNAQSTTLFELNQGVEVIVRHHLQDWIQITYPGGLSGWVERQHLLPSSGHTPW